MNERALFRDSSALSLYIAAIVFPCSYHLVMCELGYPWSQYLQSRTAELLACMS